MVTTTKPLLPTYSDSESDSTGSRRGSMEKTPYAAAHPAAVGDGAFDESSTVLSVGNSRPRSAFTRTKDRFLALGTGKKVLVLAGVGWAAYHVGHGAWHHIAGPPGPHHGPHDFSVPGAWDTILEHDHFKAVATEFAEPNYLVYSEFLAGSDLQTANATFDISHARGVSFDLADNVEGRVVLSYDAGIAEPQVVVESVWQGEDDANSAVGVQQAVQMGLGDRASSLMIKELDMPVFHTLHLIVPSLDDALPALRVASAYSLPVIVHPSAEGAILDALDVSARDGDIDFSADTGSALNAGNMVIVAPKGGIRGNFTVSRVLILRSEVGDIDVDVTVISPPEHRNGSHPPEHRPPHGGPGGKHDKHGKHGDDEKEKRGWPSRRNDRDDRRPHPPPPPPHHHHPEHPRPPHRGPGEHPHPHPHPPPPPPHGREEPFIGIHSDIGNVTVRLHSPKDAHPSVDLRADVGSVTLHDEEHHLEGFFHAQASVGKVEVVVPDNRAVDIIHQHQDGVGCVIDGIVHGAHNQSKVFDEEDAVTIWNLEPEENEAGQGPYEDEEEEHDGPKPQRPPHGGPGDGDMPRPPHAPPPPPHGPPPPRPPKGPGGPDGPGRPHGPGGPHHDRSSIRVVADVGNAKIIF